MCKTHPKKNCCQKSNNGNPITNIVMIPFVALVAIPILVMDALG